MAVKYRVEKNQELRTSKCNVVCQEVYEMNHEGSAWLLNIEWRTLKNSQIVWKSLNFVNVTLTPYTKFYCDFQPTYSNS